MSDIQETDSTPAIPNKEISVGVPVSRPVLDEEDSFDEGGLVGESMTALIEPEGDSPSGEAPTESKSDVKAGDEPNEDNKVQHIRYDVEPGTLTIDPTRPIYAVVPDEKIGKVAMALLPTITQDLETFQDQVGSADENDLDWLVAIERASEVAYEGEGLIRAAIRRGSKWKNAIENPHSNIPLSDYRAGHRSFKEPASRVTGSQAVEMFMAGTNLGRPITIPLWHSGIWVRLRAPTAAFLAEIDRALAFSREEVGMDLYGAIGSNDKLLFDEVLIDAALKLVSETNVPIANSPMELKEYISHFDIDTLIWGMAEAAFPDGCKIAIPCPSCKHVTTVDAKVYRMRFVDESRLTTKQIQMMSGGIMKKITVEDLKTYQEEFEVLNSQSWNWKGRKFTYRSPTIQEYLTSGREYISSVGRALTETLRKDVENDERRAAATRSILDIQEACRYSHFIKEVRIPETKEGADENFGIVNDHETILQILRTLSGDYESTSSFITSVTDYINDAIAVIIGFPNVPCPNCGEYYLSNSGAATLVVPFDPATGFFTLAQHKISEAGPSPLTRLSTLGVTGLLSRVSGQGALV